MRRSIPSANHHGWRPAMLMLAWMAGVAWHLQQPALLSLRDCLIALLLAAILIASACVRRGVFVLALCGAVLLGNVVANGQASLRLAEHLPGELEGRDLVVTGVIASLPQRGPSGLRFSFDAESATLDAQPVVIPSQLVLGWYKGFHEDAALVQPRSEVRAGQRWRFAVRLRQPHGNLNPGGFDYELFLFEQGVRATGYVRDVAGQGANVRLADGVAHPVERLRQRVRDAIEERVPDPRAAGVLAALAVGDQAAISREDWDLYRSAGVAHLMSISGVHVTMFAWLAGMAVAALWRRSARLMILLPAPLAARWGGLAAATAYALFSGWGVPSQRTVWMLATVTVLQSSGMRWPWLMVLLLAGFVVTLIDPWALTQAGFWLSFMAVGLLMISSPGAEAEAGMSKGWLRRLGAVLMRDLRTQVIATLGLAPLTLLFFQQISIVGFAANVIAIPAVTLVITPLALLGIAVAPIWSVGAAMVRIFNAYLAMLTGLPGAVWIVPVAPLWAQAAGLLAAALLVAPLPWRLRLLALPLALPLFLPPRTLPADGSFDLIAADVGQGTSVLVRTRGHVLIFDAGPQYSSESDAGQRVLVPLLRAGGDTHIDRLVLSHRDLDHVGGAKALLTSLDVDEVLSSLEPEHPLLAAAKMHTRCEAGQAWTWDGVRFAILRPPAADYDRARKSNAMSCVLHVSGAGRSVLLTGDIEAEQEAALLADNASALASDVLIVPHHGSRTSSSPAFIDAVHPATAVFQAGYRNRFGHPAPDVVQRYRDRGIAIVASPACGAWRWLATDGVEGVCQRDAARRYWHHQFGP